MNKCINCAWFPWKPGTDISMTPAVRCRPDKAMRKWTNESAAAENNCSAYKPMEGAVMKDDTNAGTEDKAPKAAKRSNTGRKK